MPTLRPTTRLSFSDTELALLTEFLRIAQQSILETADALFKTYPTSLMVERLRLDAETAADIRERIEERA